MNVPAIRKALERLSNHAAHCQCSWMVMPAVVKVGLRACDEWDASYRTFGGNGWAVSSKAFDQMLVIADILREAGVEVSE